MGATCWLLAVLLAAGSREREELLQGCWPAPHPPASTWAAPAPAPARGSRPAPKKQGCRGAQHAVGAAFLHQWLWAAWCMPWCVQQRGCSLAQNSPTHRFLNAPRPLLPKPSCQRRVRQLLNLQADEKARGGCMDDPQRMPPRPLSPPAKACPVRSCSAAAVPSPHLPAPRWCTPAPPAPHQACRQSRPAS